MKHLTKLSLLALVIFLIVGTVFAQGRGRGMGKGGPAWDEDRGDRPQPVEFTTEQKSKFIEIGADLAEKQVPIHAKLDQLHLQLDEMHESKNLDEKKLRSLMSEIGELKAELQINHMKAEEKARTFLTAEQLEQLGDRPVPFMGPGGKGHGFGHKRGFRGGKRGRGPGFENPPYGGGGGYWDYPNSPRIR